MRKIEVTIIPEDFRDAPNGYFKYPLKSAPFSIDPTPCVLEVALKRVLGEEVKHVGFRRAIIGDYQYLIPTEGWGRHDSPYPPSTIDELSEKAKISLEGIPTIPLVLELDCS